MASERQIAANRRNARKSSGPHSGAGKKRASRNAYRHGLTLSKAVRRVLPELRKPDRYERRAAVRRRQAVLHFFGRMSDYNPRL